jgi:adenylosuccinate lyase
MRKYDIPNPYEKLKELTRGKTVTKDDFIKFIDSLEMPLQEKQSLKELTPQNYIGYAEKLAKNVSKY